MRVIVAKRDNIHYPETGRLNGYPPYVEKRRSGETRSVGRPGWEIAREIVAHRKCAEGRQ